MIDEEAARHIAQERIDRHPGHLVVTETREIPEGWVFFYNSRRYLESGDIRDSVAGNAPLIVDRDDGTVHTTGTARDIDYYIGQYRALKAWNHLHAREPWVVPDAEISTHLLKEALTEIDRGHALANRGLSTRLRCVGCDDVVFQVDGRGYAVIHLTWSGKSERAPWPNSQAFAAEADLTSFLNQHEH